ncbi:hypothetical protein IEO21_07120 [Rhodonia placenta]|uniref:Uncharacterized protein n=1 Tax=Rhodonia placenta TaxID=104341 RepID=A0A8H7NZ41_9APHY|nr:hypothetical protein IEO21_07120 [Postia placenta]
MHRCRDSPQVHPRCARADFRHAIREHLRRHLMDRG